MDMAKITEPLMGKDDELLILESEIRTTYEQETTIYDERLSLRRNIQERVEICLFAGATNEEIQAIFDKCRP